MPGSSGSAEIPALSPSAEQLGEQLGEMPLASALDLHQVTGIALNQVRLRLRELKEAGLVDQADLGWTRRRAARSWLTESGVVRFAVPDNRWHSEAGRCRLLEIFPAAEWFYQVVGSVREPGGPYPVCLAGRGRDRCGGQISAGLDRVDLEWPLSGRARHIEPDGGPG